ncbi:MAG: efflux RND transporter periplasmic adaptor subunit [Verrucomicrobia bacterium]|nr:efflux RND transporter periplasmic adaptor subunit [Verrucomicrobiota bacterium]
MKKKSGRKILVFSILGVGLTGLALLAIFHKHEVVITVQTEPVARRAITELVVASGRIQPVVQVVINPEVSGEIIELPVKEGQQVRKNDLLVKIKPENYIASTNSSYATYRSALASMDLAKATLDKSELEYQRSEKLFRDQLISDSQLLEAKTTFDVAKASYQSAFHQADQAKAAMAKSVDDLLKTTILSPLDGTITKLKSQLGERVVGSVMMQGTELMTIANLNDMEARVDIGEVDVVLIAVGQKARLEVDSFRDRKFAGLVTDIGNSSKTAGQSGGGSSQEATKFEVRIRISEKESFRPGMSITGEIETRYRTNVLAVPIQSVTTRLPKEPAGGAKKTGATNAAASLATNAAPKAGTNTTNTATVTSSKKSGEAAKPIEVVFVKEGNRVKMIPVQRGISDDSHVEITEGLKEGQEVVSGGYKAINRELEDGKTVKIGSPPSELDKEKK